MVLNIIQWNLRGYLNNYSNLQLLISEEDPDIVCLQETKCKQNLTPIIPSKYLGYFFNTQNTSKQGTAILIKKNIPHRLLKATLPLCNVALEINLSTTFTIFSLYIPPQDAVLSSQLINLISNIKTPILILGDLNGWNPIWGSPTSNKRGEIIEDFVTNSNLAVLNNGSPTHLSTHNTLTHIDIGLSSIDLLPKCIWHTINDLHNSDHFPTKTELNLSTNFSPSFQSKYITDKANWPQYRKNILSNSISTPISDNINKESALIRKIIRSSANNAIPQTSHKSKTKMVAWWSCELQILRTDKQTAWRQFCRNMSNENLIDYKRKNAIFNRAKKIAKVNAFHKFTLSLNPSSSTSHLWKSIKLLTGNFTPHTIRSIKKNGCIISNASGISNAFAEYWSSNSDDSNFSHQFRDKKTSLLLACQPSSPCSTKAKCLEDAITYQEFNFSLNSSKGKTPGLDKISYPMLKNAPTTFKKRILDHFNSIFDSGNIPQYFKIAATIPIVKPKKPINQLDSYRPISLLPCTAKVLEKIVSKRLMWYLKKHKLLSPNQVGFQSGLSTTDALLFIDHIICKNRSTKNHTSVLSIDFIKAFDKVGIHIVLRKLSEWDIGPKMFNFIKSFLKNRKCTAKVNNNLSNIVPLHNGIPQGSPLSVTLFVVAFDDLSRMLHQNKKIYHCIYADDLYIIAKNRNNPDIKQELTKCLHQINIWSETSGAIISFDKTKHLHICRKRNCNEIDIEYNNNKIENVNCCKILGIYIDCKYSFKEHCAYLKKDLHSRLNIIKYLSSSKSQMHSNSLLKVAQSVILSKIDYGLIFYYKSAKSVRTPIETVLHSAVRTSLRAYRTTPIQNLLAEGGFESLAQHTLRLKSRLTHKILSDQPKLLSKELSLLKKRKTQLKYPSTLCNIYKISKKLMLSNYKEPNHTYAPWSLGHNLFIDNLTTFNKNTTNPKIYQALSSEIFNEYKSNGWEILFTDGSKTNTNTSFAVVTENGIIQSSGLLPDGSNIFDAEAIAILKATEICKKRRRKTLICSDSRSVFEACINIWNKNETITLIQQLMMGLKNKIKLMWIPSHVGISGNEHADVAAKNIPNRIPTYTFTPLSKKFTTKSATNYVNGKADNTWSIYNHPYKNINPGRTPISLPLTTTCHENKCFIRLRLNHTRTTHGHIISKEPPPVCIFCNNINLTIDHLLSNCTALQHIRQTIFKTPDAFDFLKHPSPDNIKNIYNFLKTINLHNNI